MCADVTWVVPGLERRKRLFNKRAAVPSRNTSERGVVTEVSKPCGKMWLLRLGQARSPRFGIAGALHSAVMARNTVFIRRIRLSTALLLLGLLGRPAMGAEVTFTRTNWNERWITNV